MQIYLLRHGLAEEGTWGMRDADRALVPAGRQKTRRVLEQAHLAGVAPTAIVTSPYRRARETAEIASAVLRYHGELQEMKALTPDGAPEDVWTELRAYEDEPQVMLVSHEPLLSALAGYLLGLPRLPIEFRKSGLVRIDAAANQRVPAGLLQWILTPGVCP